MTEAEIRRHNARYARGWNLARPHMLLAGSRGRPKPHWVARWRLRGAIRCFNEVLTLAPDNWAALWALGKVHQTLGDPAAAFECFARAFALNPSHADVAREAGAAAMDLGHGDEALRYCKAALTLKPQDAGLTANLALAQLIGGRHEEAMASAIEAVSRDPTDAVSRGVLHLIQDVAAGRRPQPRTLRDADGPTA